MKFNNLFFDMRSRVALVALAFLFIASACQTEFTNPNNPTDEEVLNSREGLIALSVGVKQLYSENGLRWLIETPAVTTREVGITTTFLNMIELEEGGSELPNNNSNIDGMWSTMLRIINSCDDLTSAADRVVLAPETRASVQAFGRTIKAMSIGVLAQHFEQVVVEPDVNNSAAFVSRDMAFASAIAELEAARAGLSTGVPTAEFQSTVLQGMDLANTINAMLARFNLYAGNYEAAVTAANAVDLTAMSIFEYDLMNANPLWTRVFLNNAPNWKPRDNFGLPAAFTVAPDDGRRAFYLVARDSLFNLNNLPIEDLAGFFTTPTTSIPVYLPDEMRLIIAEATLRSGGTNTAAIAQINAVRTDDDDIYGVNAGLAEYAGATTTEALLNEVYLQRRLELFLTGQSLEDSRRFGRPEPGLGAGDFASERNRNFYPYPERERNNNANVPEDPRI